MTLLRSAALLLAFVFMSGFAHAQAPTMKELATLVFTCIDAGSCGVIRTLNIDDQKNPYNEIGFQGGGYRVEFTVPVNQRRLEVHFKWKDSERTLIDTDLDGVVDHVIHIDKKKNEVTLIGKDHVGPHHKIQDLYHSALSAGAAAFTVRQSALKK